MKSILIAEDDPFLADIYTKKLEEAGFSIEVAKDGEEALKKLGETKPDLLILDIVLPNIEGWKLLEHIQEEPSLKDLKVIILSNLSEKTEIEKGLKLGAMKYFIKAYYTPTQVIKEIKEILR